MPTIALILPCRLIVPRSRPSQTPDSLPSSFGRWLLVIFLLASLSFFLLCPNPPPSSFGRRLLSLSGHWSNCRTTDMGYISGALPLRHSKNGIRSRQRTELVDFIHANRTRVRAGISHPEPTTQGMVKSKTPSLGSLRLAGVPTMSLTAPSKYFDRNNYS